MARARRRANLQVMVGLAVCLCAVSARTSVSAQDDAPETTPPLVTVSPIDRPPRRENRAYFGMWTTHLKHRPIGLDNNWVIGAAYRGYFAATFLNLYGRRAIAGGIQRTIFSSDTEPLGFGVGYRLGIISGYDSRLMSLAGRTPVLPLVQPYASIEIERVAFEVSFTFVVVSVSTSYKF